jgi:ribosomal protein L37E
MSAGKYRKEQNCLNCGAHVEKHYCSACGQPNLELKENFWQFISHSVAHYFHFDNKFFSTLSPLLTKPGKVTLDYLAGKRARYINPVSMYIFVSIVYFLVVATPKKHKEEHETNDKVNTKEIKNTTDSVKNALNVAGMKDDNPIVRQTVKSLDKSLKIRDFKNLDFKKQELIINNLKKENDSVNSDSLQDIINDYENFHIIKNDTTYEAYLSRQQKLSAEERDNWFERIVKKRSINLNKNLSVIDQTLEHNRPKQYFLLMPLLALFIMLNFRKNHIYYLNHLIFTIHGMTAYFIIQIFTEPLIKYVFGKGSILTNIIELGVIVWICWYMYNALKIFYQRKKWTIIYKMFWIIALYSIALEITEVVMRNLIYYFAT